VEYKFLYIGPGKKKFTIEHAGKKYEVPAQSVHLKEYVDQKEIEAPQIRDSFINVKGTVVKIGDMLEITHVGGTKYTKPRHAQVLRLFGSSRVELSPYMVDTEVVDLKDFTFSNHNHFNHFEARAFNTAVKNIDGTYQKVHLTEDEIMHGGTYTPE